MCYRPELLATQRALALVARGVPFREAYRRTKLDDAAAGSRAIKVKDIALPDYPGAPGNPDWSGLTKRRQVEERWLRATTARLHKRWELLLRG
ncbi:MAG: hypothetical protein ABI333_15495 [bacterium]